MSRSACSRIACTTRGWQCPRLLTARPVWKSRYSLPSSSHSRAPCAADELDAHPSVGRDQVVALEGLEIGEGHTAGLILVPMPASVKSSSSSECGTRPSTMWAKVTPP